MELIEFEQRRRQNLPLRREILCASSASLSQFNTLLNPLLINHIEQKFGEKYKLDANRTGRNGCYAATNPIRYWEIKLYKNFFSSTYIGEIAPEPLLNGGFRLQFYIIDEHWAILEKAIDELIAEMINSVVGFGVTDQLPSKVITSPSSTSIHYVDPNRLEELRSISSKDFDLSKLIRFCEELNVCYQTEMFFATLMLVRSILDHLPPILGYKSFPEIANNYGDGGKSFKETMQHLEYACRKIADSYLHLQIRRSEVLPTATQVNFTSELDLLLGEVVRILKK